MELEKINKEIELRSGEVQEVMGKIPSWIVRWGITLLFAVVAVLLVGSYFFKYPDVVAAEMTLTGQYPAAQVVARSPGKISKLYASDGQLAQPRTLLAIIENPASAEDMQYLKESLLRFPGSPDSLLKAFSNNGRREGFALGGVQPAYSNFLAALHEYGNYYALDYYPKKIAAIRMQTGMYQANYRNLQRQQQVVEAQYQIAAQQYRRDSLLFARGILSASEHEAAQAAFLQSRYALESGYIALENLQVQVVALEADCLDMELQQAEKESTLVQGFRAGMEQLSNAIQGWELDYCLFSPVGGKVSFTTYWHENQYVQAGENVFTVVPGEEDGLTGKALLPLQRSGKVKPGQRVVIRFANFPDQEFGTVGGVVKSISLVPAGNNYQVGISFPNGLVTNYGKTLPVSHEMQATAEIVTGDLRLLERFFMPLKRIWKEGFLE